MSRIILQIRRWQAQRGLIYVIALLSTLATAGTVLAETYGIKEADGSFVPKITVVLDRKEMVIKKTNPKDRFQSISLKLNPANKNLLKNAALLSVEWIAHNNKASRPVPFAGPNYERKSHVFQDSMERSAGMRILDKSGANLFSGKALEELFSIRLDHQPLISAETATERERTVRLGTGRDVSINVDKTSLAFNWDNLKKGEMVNVDNRTGKEQFLGIQIPQKGFVSCQVRRRLEQTKIPPQEWDRFSIPAEQGIFIVLIPERDPVLLSQLDGKEIVIRVYQGNEVRETIRIPVEVSADVRSREADVSAPSEPVRHVTVPRSTVSPRGPKTENGAQPKPRPEPSRSESRGGFLMWALLIFNMILLVFLAVYTIFFMLPKIQVLEDRVAKSEMFIHGIRGAIREELDQIKREIVQQCQQDEEPE